MTTDTVGGVWTYSVDLAGQLALRGHDVILASLGGYPSLAQTAQVARLPGVQLHSSGWKLEWMDDPWDEVDRSGDWVLDLAAQNQPDIVHLNTLGHGALPWKAPTLLVAHSCVLSWWQAVKSDPAPAAWNTYRERVTASLRGADAFVTPSKGLLAQLVGLYGPLPGARVIYNGRAAAGFLPAEKEEFILATGRLWDEAKNVSALTRVAHRLPWPVYAAGDAQSPDGRRFDPGGVHLLGHLPDGELAAWLGRAAIFVAPARYEPFGLGILEAALAGCALVLGDITSLREIWAESALYVPPGNEEALSSALARLAQEPSERETLSRHSRARASIYSLERMTDRYIEMYRGMLRPSALPPPSSKLAAST